MRKKQILSLITIVVMGSLFQNCAKLKSSDEAGVLPLVYPNEGGDSGQIIATPFDDVIYRGRIDLLDYMVSKNIKEGVSNIAFSRLEYETGEGTVFSIVKFNDSNNIEVFQADEDFVYLRYESTPESYGGIKNVIRRFESSDVGRININDSVKKQYGEAGLGAIWSKRYLNVEDIDKPILTAHGIDVFNFTEKETTPRILTEFSVPSKAMFIWHSFERVLEALPFVSNEHQPDHKLIISQQWSECNVEQYEYAQGVGYVGWRSLVADHIDCAHLLKGRSLQSRTTLQNYFRRQQEEYVVVQGLAVGSLMDKTSYQTVAIPSFYVGSVFIDDYPYVYTESGNSLTLLRNRGVLPVVKPKPQNNYREVVSRLYRENLRREADSGGLNYYIGLMSKGSTENEIREYLRESNEFKVGELYRLHLRREVDSAGLNFYLGLMSQGSTENEIRQYLQESNEFKVGELYRLHLRRDPDPAGLHFYLGKIDTGTSMLEIKQSLQRSPECKQSCL